MLSIAVVFVIFSLPILVVYVANFIDLSDYSSLNLNAVWLSSSLTFNLSSFVSESKWSLGCELLHTF